MKASKIITLIASKVAHESAAKRCPWNYNQPKVPQALIKAAKK